ncbi:DUF3159 domain-containing protein [Sanguibacter sp. A247]|uniref:DUF3159 domain-containing protein n=1 Tax=unclassified Sanguibacter TaxID=2645534 RepID=UPI003FD88053
MTTSPPEPARGMRQLAADEFSLSDSVGGLRGVIETLLPGVVFVVVYIATGELKPTIFSALGVALLAVVVRLVQRTPVTQAFSGVLGVAIGVVWAWRSGEVEDFFLFSLLTNAAYLLVCLVSILVRWPAVGIVAELLRTGLTAGRENDAPTDADAQVDAAEERERPEPSARDVFGGWSHWRADPTHVRRYAVATWFWVALFGVRLAVKTPLYLDATTEWLGIAHLVLGVPLWALTLWATWIVVHPLVRASRRGSVSSD